MRSQPKDNARNSNALKFSRKTILDIDDLQKFDRNSEMGTMTIVSFLVWVEYQPIVISADRNLILGNDVAFYKGDKFVKRMYLPPEIRKIRPIYRFSEAGWHYQMKRESS